MKKNLDLQFSCEQKSSPADFIMKLNTKISIFRHTQITLVLILAEIALRLDLTTATKDCNQYQRLNMLSEVLRGSQKHFSSKITILVIKCTHVFLTVQLIQYSTYLNQVGIARYFLSSRLPSLRDYLKPVFRSLTSSYLRQVDNIIAWLSSYCPWYVKLNNIGVILTNNDW